MADDTAALVVALSAQLTKFEKDMKDAVKIADTQTKLIETRFTQMNSKIEQEFTSFIGRYTAAAGPLGGILGTLGPVGTTIAAGIGAAIVALGYLNTKADEYIEKQRKLKEASETTGLSVGQLKAVGQAARETGVDFDKAEAGILKMSQAIDHLRETGQGPLADTLNKINPELTKQVITSKSVAEAVDILTKALQGIDNQYRQTGAAAEIFGRRNIETLRVLRAALAEGGLSAAPEESKDAEDFRNRLIALDNQLKNSKKTYDDTLGKMIAEWIRIKDISIWDNSTRELKTLQGAISWFSGFVDDVLRYVSAAPGVKTANENLANLRMPQIGGGGPQPRAAQTTAVPSREQYLTAYTGMTVETPLPQARPTQAIQAAKDLADQLENDKKLLNENIAFMERWAGVLGDAITPAERLAQKQNEITKSLQQYAPGSKEYIQLQEAGARSTQKLTETLDIQAIAIREQLGVATEQQIFAAKQIAIDQQVRDGRLSLIDAEKALTQARIDSNRQFTNMVTKLGTTPELTKFAAEAQDQVKQFSTFATTTFSNFESALGSVANGTTKLADAFKNMTNSIISDLVKIATRIAITGPLSNLLASALGGTPAPAGGTNLFQSLFPPQRQGGGPVTSGSPYIVGEHGPELFVPGHSGQIVPGSITRAGAPSQIVVNNYVAADTQVNQRREGSTFDTQKYVIDIVKKAQARGELDDSSRGRFALRPQKVR